MKYLVLLASFAMFVSCGKSGTQWVTDFNYQTADQDDQKWLVSDFKLNLGENEVPDLNYPLPRDYGYFRSWRLNGENFLGLDLNLSTILGLPGGVATLPNGQVLPVDTNGVGVVQVQLDQINGRVYLAVANGTTLFNIKGIDVMAGMYASETPGKTGIAIFATIGGIWEETVAMGEEVFQYRPEYVSVSKRRQLARKLRKIMSKKQKISWAER
jgi:hypothetical protein